MEHLLPLIAPLPACVIGMEACSGTHHWARQFRQHGHTVRLMAPKFVTPTACRASAAKNDAPHEVPLGEALVAELTGAARLYRAASELSAWLGTSIQP